MRTRPSSRLIILSHENRILLFRYRHTQDALRGRSHWATPGGALEQYESYEQAAIRELFEETGMRTTSMDPPIASRTFTMQLPSGETVLAEERFFIIRRSQGDIDRSHWTDNERCVIGEHYWWSLDELKQTKETIFPHDLLIKILED